VMIGNRRRLALVAAVCLAGSAANADWTACQRHPTRACLLEEALRGDGAPLAGKDRLDILILAGAIAHPEYATAADLDEAVRQAQSTPNGYNYANLAVQGLVAENRQQQAADLVASLHGPIQHLAIHWLARALAKAGDFDAIAALFDRMAPILDSSARYDLKHIRVVESVKAAADAGKVEDALLIMMSIQAEYPPFPDVEVADMQTVVAQAYVGRGDIKKAQRLLDLAQQRLEKAQHNVVAPGGAETIRFMLISLSGLRGDAAAVRTALQQLPPESTDRSAANLRNQGYQQVVAALLKNKQFPLALEVAKSAPAPARDQALLMVNTENAANGRIDDARAVMSSFSEKMDPKTRAIAVRNVAVAMVKAGKLAAAVEMAAQASDPVGRRAVLFAIAQALPQ
jgi:hypothetical protein